MRSKKFVNALCLLISAVSVGWIAGMSVSPVVDTVVSSLLSVLVAIASLSSGLNDKATAVAERSSFIKQLAGINLLSIAVLTAGIVIGSCLGIYTRTHQLLEKQQTSLKITSEDNVVSQNRAAAALGVLYSLPAHACGDIGWRHGADLQRALTAYQNENIIRLVNDCNGNAECLELIKKMVCEYTK